MMLTEDEYAEAYATQFSRTMGVLRRLDTTLSLDAAWDINQDAWLLAWKRRETFTGESTFFTWVCRIAINQCLNLRRTAKRRHVDVPLFEVDAPRMPPDPTVNLQIRAAMKRCTPRQREFLQMFYLTGMKHSEIAKVSGMTEKNVNLTLVRARQKARGVAA